MVKAKKEKTKKDKALAFHLLTLFPQSFDSYLKSSILGRALSEGKIRTEFYFLRDFSGDKHRRVDLRPYGGGPGMVMRPEPILKAYEAAKKKIKKGRVKLIVFSPNGKQFTNELAEKWGKEYDHLILISGRYEGIYARVKKILKAEEVTVGPYVLTGGELPSLLVMDAITRRLPGVLGNEISVEERRISSSEVYTRPEILKYKGKNYKVPKVLLSGHHGKIEDWKKKGK